MRPEDICRSYNNWIVARRWAATWLDFLLFGGTLFALLAVWGEKLPGLAFGIWLVLGILYYPLLEGFTGQTFGKWLCRLKVVNEQGGSPGPVKAIVRTLLRIIELNPLLMGGLPAGIAVLASPKRQRLGDMAAHTYVLMTEDLKCLTMSPAALTTYDLYGGMPPPLGATTAPPLWNLPASPDYKAPLPSAETRGWALPGACLVTLAALGLVAAGVWWLQSANRTRHPVKMSCEQFLQNPPKEGWYHLTGCTLNISEAVFQTYQYQARTSTPDAEPLENEPIYNAYVPVYATQDTVQKQTSLLLVTDDEPICDLVNEMRKLDESDEKKAEEWVLANYDRLIVRKDITGTIQTELDTAESMRDQITKLQEAHLTRNYVMLKEGDTPLALGPIGTIVFGVFVGFLAFGFWIVVLVSMTQRSSP